MKGQQYPGKMIYTKNKKQQKKNLKMQWGERMSFFYLMNSW